MKNDSDVQVRVPRDTKKQAVAALAKQGVTISESVRDHLFKCAGQWNAYVASGKTVKTRCERLAEVPESMRDSVIDHVKTVFKLRGLPDESAFMS